MTRRKMLSHVLSLYMTKKIESTDTQFGKIKNVISGSSASLGDTRLQTSLNEGITHGNGLGVGRSANMGVFNPFLILI